MAEGRHRLQLDDNAVSAIVRSIKAHSEMLHVIGRLGVLQAAKEEADLLAHVSAVVQEHALPNCGCTPPKPREDS